MSKECVRIIVGPFGEEFDVVFVNGRLPDAYVVGHHRVCGGQVVKQPISGGYYALCCQFCHLRLPVDNRKSARDEVVGAISDYPHRATLVCPDCEGQGHLDGASLNPSQLGYVECPECNGTGLSQKKQSS